MIEEPLLNRRVGMWQKGPITTPAIAPTTAKAATLSNRLTGRPFPGMVKLQLGRAVYSRRLLNRRNQSPRKALRPAKNSTEGNGSRRKVWSLTTNFSSDPTGE